MTEKSNPAVAIAAISAISAVVVALITTLGTISASENKLSDAIKKVSELEKKINTLINVNNVGIDGWPIAIKCNRFDHNSANNIYWLTHTSYDNSVHYERADSAYGEKENGVQFGRKTKLLVKRYGNNGKLLDCNKGTSIDDLNNTQRAYWLSFSRTK